MKSSRFHGTGLEGEIDMSSVIKCTAFIAGVFAAAAGCHGAVQSVEASPQATRSLQTSGATELLAGPQLGFQVIPRATSPSTAPR